MTDEELRSKLPALRPRLVAYARRCVNDSDEAEDIVQDALLRMWLIRDRLIGPVDGMAMVIVRNLSLDFLRKKRKMDALTDMEKLEMETMKQDSHSDNAEELWRIVASLPEKQRNILRMHDVEGVSYEELSEVMGISAATLRQNVSRTRRVVRVRYLAAIGAAVALMCMVTLGWLSWQDYQLKKQYEGSYVIVNGKRNSNLRQIRPQLEDALSWAGDVEHNVQSDAFMRQAENDVLNHISDPAERQRLREILNDE